MKRAATRSAACLLALLSAVACERGCERPPAKAELPPPPAAPAAPKMKPTSGAMQAPKAKADAEGFVTLGKVRINPEKGELHLPGQFCLHEGVLEFIAVARGGHAYESLVEVDVKGSNLHLGLVLLGVEQTPVTLEHDGPKLGKTGGKVSMEIRWEKDGKARVDPLSHFVKLRMSERDSWDKVSWLFTGSYFIDEVYQADVTNNLIASWLDPYAVVNIGEDLGNPYRSDGGAELLHDNIPPKGTPMTLVLKRQ